MILHNALAIRLMKLDLTELYPQTYRANKLSPN